MTAWLRYDSEFCLKLAANRSCRFDLVDTELWASCFAADSLSAADQAPPPMSCYTCGSLSHLYAACPQCKRPNFTRNPAAAKQDPLTSSETNLLARTGGSCSRNPATSLMTKTAVFRALDAPISTHAHTAGVSTLSRAAPCSGLSTLSVTIRLLPLARILHQHPNSQFVTTLLSHLTHCFDIGYQGPHMDVRAPNLPSVAVHPEVVTAYLHKECTEGRMAGPFPQPPFSPFHCSGLGVV